MCSSRGQGGAAPCPRRAHNPARVIVGYNLYTEFTLRQRYKIIFNRQASSIKNDRMGSRDSIALQRQCHEAERLDP